MSDSLRRILKKHPRYQAGAYHFLFEALEDAVRLSGRSGKGVDERHVTGQELLEGLRARSLAMFGPLAAHVWRSWGIHRTRDWGEIVFLLVDEGMMNRQETDRIEDFDDVFDLDSAFVENYCPNLPPAIEPNAGG
ncbi:MAG: hypothetical protein R3F17_05550 [Planctomycetota bacterium]